MRHLPSAAAALAALLLALACGSSPEPEPAPPAEEAAAPEEGADARAGKSKKGGKQKKGDRRERQGAPDSPDEVIAAYLADCHHVFPPEGLEPDAGEFGDGEEDECRWRPFDQNCAADTFGCFSQGQECLEGCERGCASCQEACASTCDGCKARCRGDSACERGCAEARAGCRGTCTSGRSGCDGGCASAEQACAVDSQKTIAEKCPGCSEIARCRQGTDPAGQPPDHCLRQNPGNAPECLEWCWDN